MADRLRNMDDGRSTAGMFAARLDALFRRVHPPHRTEYTYEEVANGVRAGGYEISPAYVWQLRKGKSTNPTLRHIEGLAKFWGVPAAYFLDPDVAEQVDHELELLATMRDSEIKHVALRAYGLSAEGLAMVRDMIENVRRYEQVPDESEQLPTQSEDA